MDAAVIIVGAGPSGLTLAAELRLAGIDTIVVERLEKPSGESRGLGFTARTMELFDQRGLLPEFGDAQISPHGHFGGINFDYRVLEGAHFGLRGVPQARIERILEDWATRLGADVRRGVELTGLDDDGTAVTAHVTGPDGAAALRAPWLVACDGGRSTARRLAGFAFPGTEATMEMYLADVAGPDLRPRPLGERLPNGMVMSAPLGDGYHRVIVCPRGVPARDRRAGPPPFAEVAGAWKHITGEDIGAADARWVSAFGDATRQVTEYRRGRVLIAGDAAHVHLPAGGQGLSTGVQDVMNLGWKLAAEARGWAPPGLLDTYHAERHPVGARLLANTRAQGTLFLGGADVEPLRSVLAGLMAETEVRRHLAGMVSGLDVRYDVGPGDHPLLGMRVPPVGLLAGSGPTSTVELLRDGRGYLLDAADDAALRAAAAPWADRVRTVTAVPRGPGGPLDGTAALLVRPDGHIAWTSPGGGDPAPALARWFGAPAR
ncbi:FAD-dependent monooxygenase [Actinomadura atramentaria]|uniref:FAD-dependent monooxygenase n=1 Tax=Actinomadura atramentaria TaxID=1990 RepID=UPI0003724A1D|nr:FAD-dependent monooxygenase [Actinomadura atramentaria]